MGRFIDSEKGSARYPLSGECPVSGDVPDAGDVLGVEREPVEEVEEPCSDIWKVFMLRWWTRKKLTHGSQLHVELVGYRRRPRFKYSEQQ